MTSDWHGQTYVLTLACPDRPGIVHSVSGFLLEQNATIVESQQYQDPESDRFFMRVGFRAIDGAGLDHDRLRDAFGATVADGQMNWRLVDTKERQRVVIMVSKFAHCLNDLLFRNSVGELNLDIVAVVSNHPDLQPFAQQYGIPFVHIPVTKDTKAEAEAQLLQLVRDEQVDLVVLARYMQILSDDLCSHLEGRAINIHHSMLPSFKGARPYHQAHARGVKVIGATAHYVTGDLDEGPIIEQEVLKVDHSLTAEEFATRGRGLESRALAKAVRWHTENRIMRNGHKTVVFQ